MAKKDYVMGIIDNLRKHRDLMPQHLQTVFDEVHSDLQSVSSYDFFLQSNGAVTGQELHQTPNPNAPLLRLSEAYFDLKKVAEANRSNRPELVSAVNQLEAVLQESDNYSPE